ncbi:hypothetical protein [Isoptericola croceus]|uniref:hypothetical protein n=1 Tax=Isoptericola croceus TaxID=3031406 RepID=UPI0023F9A335|nr:hypothetical protein [Isoptericola croceus]
MTSADHDSAASLDQARGTLDGAGASALTRRPWQGPDQPPSDLDLVRFATWAARDPAATDPSVVAAGLGLLSSARAELDQLEAGLLFAARGSGMTWQGIASALGLGSAQAAQQRLDRVLARSHRVVRDR